MADKNVIRRKVASLPARFKGRRAGKLNEKRVHHGKRDDYVYDSLYRLTEYRKDGDPNGNNPAKTIGYTLDGVGNRTQVTGNGTPTAYSVNNLNQYTSVGGIIQTHDDNGNLLSDGTRTFSYDYANRLVRIITATQTITYRHDVFGRRIEKSVDGVATRYYYEGARTIEDRDGADATTATYVYGNGIDEILTMDRGGQTYYYHTNAQGSITEITDSTGAIVERYEYDAYGAITIFTAPGVDGLWQTADDVVSVVSAIGNRYTFTGREYEPESGLYYYRARFYDPTTGRFLQRDPIGNDMLGNLYAYVNNSPAVYVDSRGLDGEKDWKETIKDWVSLSLKNGAEGKSILDLPEEQNKLTFRISKKEFIAEMGEENDMLLLSLKRGVGVGIKRDYGITTTELSITGFELNSLVAYLYKDSEETEYGGGMWFNIPYELSFSAFKNHLPPLLGIGGTLDASVSGIKSGTDTEFIANATISATARFLNQLPVAFAQAKVSVTASAGESISYEASGMGYVLSPTHIIGGTGYFSSIESYYGLGIISIIGEEAQMRLEYERPPWSVGLKGNYGYPREYGGMLEIRYRF